MRSLDNDNFDLQQICFDAEQTLKLELAILDSRARSITETAEIQALNESFKETIVKYINKVTDGINKAWDLFKEKGIITDKIKEQFNKGQTAFNSNFRMRLPIDPPFEYPQLDQWEDINSKVTIQELNQGTYNGMKQYLESEDDFIKHYYQQYLVGDNGIRESLIQKVFPNTGSATIVDKEAATRFRDFLMTYPAQIKIIGEDLKKVNANSRNITTMLNTVLATSESTYIGNSIVLLEDDNPASKFANADTGETTAPKGGGGENSKDRTYITTFYKASSKVISAKLATCNKVRNQSLRICLNYLKLQGGAAAKAVTSKDEENQSVQTNNQTRGDQVAQVNI